MKWLINILLVLVLIMVTNCGQTDREHDTAEKIEQYLSELEQAGFYGVVLVAIDGKPIISKGYGYRDKENDLKNFPSTVFDIGSITKQFTAAAILKLEIQGKLSTDDSLSTYFGSLPMDKESITLHDLLRHQSGLISNIGKDYDRISEREFLDQVFSSTLQFEPGTDFSYSNIGYSLLAIIIEKISNQSYETYLYENLWKPSHMERTGYSRPEFEANQVAVGYSGDHGIWGKPNEKEWDNTSPYWHLKGNGGLLSTTEDLYKWHKSLLGEVVLSKEAKEKLYHPKTRAGENKNSIYAYGWDVSITNRNTRQVWHNGSNRIFYADFLRFIDEDISLIMLSNKSHPNFNNLNFELAGIIFNPTYKPEIPAADNHRNRDFTARIIQIIETSGLEKAMVAYQQKDQSEQLLEFLMRDEGFNQLDDKAEIALQFFEMNVFAYPNSAKALQGLAEGYMETGKKDLALKYFRLSQGINPANQFVNDMITKLEKEQYTHEP